MLIVKVKKFGVDWYIPYEMAADSALIGLSMDLYELYMTLLAGQPVTLPLRDPLISLHLNWTS